MNIAQKIKKEFHVGSQLNDYLKIKKGFLYYKDIKLMSLVEQYATPLEVAYTDIISERIKSLQKIFKDAIKTNKYPGKYLYAYATKANYYSEVVSTALNDIDSLETTSAYDLEIIDHLLKRGLIDKSLLIICNGFKHGNYFDKIIALKKKGLNILPVLENTDEVELFLNETNLPFTIGMRLNIDEEVVAGFENGERLGAEVDTRFGMSLKEMQESAKKINQADHLTLKLLHFHLGGTIKNTKQFIEFTGRLF